MGQSAFFGIGVGTQGLYTARTALDITNHNIANAETAKVIAVSMVFSVQLDPSQADLKV